MRTRRKLLLAAIAIVVALGVGSFIGRALGPDDDVDAPSPPSATGGVTDSGEEEQTEHGAVQAATAFARLMAGPTHDRPTYLKAVSEIATPDWRERARELAENTIDFIEDRYGAGGRLSFNPIRYRVRSYSTSQTTVDIWGVVLGSGPERDGIEESWITGTLTLVWAGDSWKLNGQTSKGGPTPELLKTDEEASANHILSDFREYDDAQGL